MPKATAVFDADDSRLGGALARINGEMLALPSRIAKFAGAFLAIRAVAGVVTAGFDHFKQALDVGGEFNDLSANTGVAVGDLVGLQQKIRRCGEDGRGHRPGIRQDGKDAAERFAADTVAKLGIKLAELKKKTPRRAVLHDWAGVQPPAHAGESRGHGDRAFRPKRTNGARTLRTVERQGLCALRDPRVRVIS